MPSPVIDQTEQERRILAFPQDDFPEELQRIFAGDPETSAIQLMLGVYSMFDIPTRTRMRVYIDGRLAQMARLESES